MSSQAGRVRFGLAALAVVLVGQSVAHAVAVFGFDSYSSVVDLNRNESVPDIFSTVAILAAALAAAMLARSRAVHHREAWALAGLLVLVAVVDVAQTDTESVSGVGALVTLVLAAVAVLIWRTARASGRSAALLLYGGLGCLVGSLAVAFVYHRVDGYFDPARGDVVHEAKIILKQGLELAGWWLAALGLWYAATPVAVRSKATEGATADPSDLARRDATQAL
jgi:hypothetical protein